MQRPNPNATGRTATGAPVMTLEDQRRLQAQQQAEYEAYMARQAAMQGQGGMQAQPAAASPAFPGSNPASQEPGLLMDTFNAIDRFFTPDKKLGEMVPASQNPLMSAPGVGIGGAARRDRIDETVDPDLQRQREAQRRNQPRR